MKLSRFGFLLLLVAVLVPAFAYAAKPVHPVAEGCAFPTITSITPNTGPSAGGTNVTITGTNYVSGMSVTFGGVTATNIVTVNSTTITATTPPGAAGAVDVAVQNLCGTATLPGGFTYSAATAPVPALSPLALALLAVALGIAAIFAMRH